MLVVMKTDALTGKVTGCGGNGLAKTYRDQMWEFVSPCAWAGGNLTACTGNTATLPLPMPSAHYLVMCETNTKNLSTVAPSGVVTITHQTPTQFGYIVTTIISMGNHNGSGNDAQIICYASSDE